MASERYELRRTANRWTVWDTAKGTPATVKDVWQVGLELQVAEELMDALNWIDEHRPAKSDSK